MSFRKLALTALAVTSAAVAQNTPTAGLTTGNGPYVPGVTYQADNPNYLNRNPFYFEGRVDWNLLKITTPSTPWEFTQRGIHYQDDLQDTTDAIADYQTAISMNNLTNNTCQLITSAALVAPNATLTPAPCMFTPRLRLAHLIKTTHPQSPTAPSGGSQNRPASPLRERLHRRCLRATGRQCRRPAFENCVSRSGDRRLESGIAALSRDPGHDRSYRRQSQ